MSQNAFSGCLLDEMENLADHHSEGEIRLVKVGGIISIFRHTTEGVHFGSGHTFDEAYAAFIRDKNREVKKLVAA